ncbi:MAG: NADPH-dependent F420 reductase [Terriglobales bacterium]
MIETVSIIGGTGPEGRGLGLRWARAGLRVIIGSREAQRAHTVARELAERVGANGCIEGCTNAEAIAAADVVVVTVPFEAQAATLKGLRAAFRPNAVVISTTVPLGTSIGDRVSRLVGVWQGSAAEQAAEFVPAGVKVASAFQNISASLLESEHDIECDAIVCSDHPDAKNSALELAGKIPGVRGIDGGKLENSRMVEALTALLIGINIRCKTQHTGLRITGMPHAQASKSS